MRHPLEILFNTVHDYETDVTVGVFPTTKLKLHAHFVSFIEKLFGTGTLNVVIMLFGTDAEFHLLHLHRPLALRSLFELGLLIFILSVINNSTHRRVSFRSDFNEIEADRFGLNNGLTGCHDSELLAVFAVNYADFRSTNTIVHPGHIPTCSFELLLFLGYGLSWLWLFGMMSPDRSRRSIKGVAVARTRAQTRVISHTLKRGWITADDQSERLEMSWEILLTKSFVEILPRSP